MMGVKTRVLILTDVYGWAWDIASKELLKNLPSNYVGTVMSVKDFLFEKPNVDSFDVVLTYIFLNINVVNRLNPENTIIGVAGWEEFENKLVWDILVRFKYFAACNSKLAEKIRGSLPGKTVWVLSHGVDTELFKPSQNKPKRFTVGWAGNQNRAMKRPTLAREAAKEAKAEFSVAGIIGSVISKRHDEMPNWYSGLSCLLVTSTSEAHSLVTYEAMACGLPVVTTITGDIDENIVDGVNGFLFPVVCSVSQITEILIKLRDNPALRDRVGEEARRTVLSRWTWREIVKPYICAFNEVKENRV